MFFEGFRIWVLDGISNEVISSDNPVVIRLVAGFEPISSTYQWTDMKIYY